MTEQRYRRFGTGGRRTAGTPGRLALLLGLLCIFAAAATAPAQSGALTFPGTTKVGSTSQPVPVTLTAQAAGTAGNPVALTSGVQNLDFAVADAGTCTSNLPMAAGQTCTVTVIFSPRFPGVRQGAVVLPSGNSLLASTPLSGIGQGSLPVLVPGEINTVAGDGQWVYRGDGVLATSAPVFLPTGLAVDGSGNLFFSDSSNNRVRRVDGSTGLVSTVAGNGTAGASGDNGPAQSAEVNNPSGLALDGAGNLYIADSGNSVVRRVDATTGVITTVAGRIGSSGYTGDGGLAVNATLSTPQGLALTPAGDLVIADTGNAAVRLLSFATGRIQTIAGTGTSGYSGDGGAATSAQLSNPWGVAVRSDGAVAIADFSNQRVRLVDTNGNISTIAGTGQRNFTGDNSLATQATLSGPAAVAFDPAGDLLIADSGNNRVRGIYGSPGIITTLAGNASEEFSGDAGPASSASLYGPYALLFDPAGNIWISDMFHNRVREINGSMLSIGYSTMRVGKTSTPVSEMMYNAGNSNLTLTAPVLSQASLDSGSTTCGQAPLSAMSFCTMGVEFAPTQVGQNITGSVQWTSDAPNVTPVDNLNGQVLSVEPTSLSLVASANPGLLGQSVTLTASVTSADSGRTGSVTFSEGANAWCTAVGLAPDGTASCTIPSLALGSHTFTANYSGDDNNAASTSSPYVEIIKQQPALALAVSSSPTVVTNNVTLTLSAVDQTGTPTGTVLFLDGATVLASVVLDSNGTATWSTHNFVVGNHTLSAQYSGDSANIAGTSSNTVEQITQASTLTFLSSSNADTTVGTPITLTATVASNNGPAPTGSVQFMDGSGPGAATLGSAPLASNGTAAMTLSTLAPGSHALVVSYSGDTDDASSTSTPLSQTVEQIATVTTLGADANPVNAGAVLHLTAIVSIASGATADGTLTGNVTFQDGSTVLGTAVINSTGQATLAVTSLSVGTHNISASFAGDTNYAKSNSVPLSETVQQTSTQITLGASSATTLVGKPATFTATVTSATGVPTGTVTFRDGSAVLGTANVDTTGNASFSTTKLTQGTHAITAVYGGDVNYLNATSTGLQETVQLAQPTVTVSTASTTVDAGTNLQLTLVLTTPGSSPSGTLTVLDGNTNVGTIAVSASGSFNFITNRLPIGTHTLTASYSGDASNAAAISAGIAVMIQQASSTTSLSTSANPLTQGGALILTATVTSNSPNPAGSVNFIDGSALLGTSALAANGTAVFSPTALGLGTHTLTAVYAGDTNHASSSSAPIPELVVQSSSEALSSSNNPSASGQSTTFTVEISGPGSTPATGAVTLLDNGALLASVPLNGPGRASFTTSVLTVGSHAITASYSGDSNFASASAQLIQTVVNASTQVGLGSSVNPGTYGQPLSLNATVVSNGGAATGTVTFTDAGVNVGSAPLNANGAAVLTLSTLSPGAHSIVANYAGDGKASPSVSTPLGLVVKQANTLSITSNSNPAQTLSPVNLTVTLANAGAAPTTGLVQFEDGAISLGTAQVDPTGHATLSLPQMSAGSHSITASYAGDGANFASTSSPFVQAVQLRSTATTVTGSSTDSANPQQVTLISVIKGQGTVPPGGTVTFTNGNLTLGSAKLDETGVATITVLFEQVSEPIVASYAGDASYTTSQSAPTTITAGQAPQFTLAVTSPNVTLVTHQHTTINVSIGSVKGFTDTIVLGCLGLPTAATCTFSNSQLKLASDGTATASLTIDTGDPLGAGSGTNAMLDHREGGTFLCWLPACGLLVLCGRKKRRAARRSLGSLLVLAIAFGLTVGLTGCSGLSTTGTPPGTYVFKVLATGQGSGTTQAQTVTMVVTQ